MHRATGRQSEHREPAAPRTLPRLGGVVVLATALHAATVTVFLQALATPRDPGWRFADAPAPRMSEQLRYIEPPSSRIEAAAVVRKPGHPGLAERTTTKSRALF